MNLIFVVLVTTTPSMSAAATGAAPTLSLQEPAPLATCRRRMGPYATQRRAYEVRRYFRARGYRVSGVWGSGGVYYGARRYYFNIFFRC